MGGGVYVLSEEAVQEHDASSHLSASEHRIGVLCEGSRLSLAIEWLRKNQYEHNSGIHEDVCLLGYPYSLFRKTIGLPANHDETTKYTCWLG